MAENGFLLDAESLMSKWGFGDGDALDDWWWDRFDTDADFDTDELLYALVQAYLVPAIRAAGHVVELVRIGTIHNPVRAGTLDGVEADHYTDGKHFDPPIYVNITVEQVQDMVRKIIPNRTDGSAER
ncbi:MULTISPECIES: hypothetical protein [unclassified Microbacterium]|uniref:hypothetical protein n=1 Tax=unclassified Microbacterium TaxID=2609290 RepID=UPI00301750CB